MDSDPRGKLKKLGDLYRDEGSRVSSGTREEKQVDKESSRSIPIHVQEVVKERDKIEVPRSRSPVKTNTTDKLSPRKSDILRNRSSPIKQKKEEKEKEDEEEVSAEPSARKARLANLAKKLNNWEDDTHHNMNEVQR